MNVTRLNLPVRKKTTLHGCAGDYLNTTGKPIRNIQLDGFKTPLIQKIYILKEKKIR